VKSGEAIRMKVFLVYLRINSGHGGDDRYSYGLGYISAVLKQAGHDITYIILANDRDLQGFYEKIEKEQPGITGFYVTASHTGPFAEIVRKMRLVTRTFIVCGGPHPTLSPESMFNIAGIDAVVRGEGEYPMRDLANALDSKSEFHHIKNLWIREGDRIIKNEMRPLIADLDELPYPDKSCLDFQKAIDESSGTIRYIFSRGCVFNCAYCSNKALSDVYGGKYFRIRSPQKAIAEIEKDMRTYTFTRIMFDDDTIHLDKKWFREFFDLYKKHVQIPFKCNIRPDIIDEEIVDMLKEAGVARVNIGVEHGNEEFRRKYLNRNMTNHQIIEVFDLFRRRNIDCFAHVMVGLPYENKKLFLDTVMLCRKLTMVQNNPINVFHPYPATPLGDLCEKKGWLLPERHYRERENSITNYPAFSKEEIELCKDAFSYLLAFRFLPLGLTSITVCGLMHRLSSYLNKKSSFYSKILVRLKRMLLLWRGSQSYELPCSQD
jgi:radical SAM superfamily enzyme YgiQ (UPF0313 family)